jgi:tetratricopeptide (TPR) repeat protein
MPDVPNKSHLDRLHAEALRLDRLGAHEHSEPRFAQLVAHEEARLGPNHPDLAPALNDLARCRFNAGRLVAAVGDYRRLLELLASDLSDPRIPLVKHQIRRCIEGVRHRMASMDLQARLSSLIRQARAQREVGETTDQERLRSLARRLIARGRVEVGARLMERWLGDVLRVGQMIEDQALADLRDHALGLWNAGHPHLAEPVLRDIVRVHQRQRADDLGAQTNALRDWGSCLAAAGQARSASETLSLAESLAPVSDDAAEDLPPLHDASDEDTKTSDGASPWLHDLMLSVLQRCTFMLSLDWNGVSRSLEVQVEGESAHVSGAIRFDGTPGNWLPLRLSVPAEDTPSFPHLDACIRMPALFPPAEDPANVLAAMSRLCPASPGVSATVDSGSGDVTLSARVVYSGCGIEVSVSSEELHLLEEITLNTVVGVLSAAQEWLHFTAGTQQRGGRD